MENAMTRNRRHKAEIRAHQVATGTAYMVARRQITPLTPAEVMQQHLRLNYFGIGVFEPHRKSPEQRSTKLAADREALAEMEARVLETAEWLRENITPIKTPTTGSYHMKHVVEEAMGRYVANGELIAAALIVGYTFKYTAPNVLFGMSARDVKRIRSAPRQAVR
jgi:hypothetical protein